MSKVKLDIEFVESTEGITPDQLHGFFEGWPDPPSPARHLEILRRSNRRILARDARSGRVVGFVTAITDGVLSAYVPLLEVLPEYRGAGLGRELMERMVRRLEPIYMIDLTCDEDVQPFYERLGWTRYTAMIRRDHGALKNAGCS